MMKEFEPTEVTACDGQDGRPAYVVHRGRVFDVSSSNRWKGGIHMKRHKAGLDLTGDFQAAPHGVEVLERYPQIGILKKEDRPDARIPPALARLLKRFPMIRRHLHPMTVHFPIVFVFSTLLFNLLYLMTGYRPFEVTAFHTLAVGIPFTLVAILTGLYTWWLNYEARLLRPIRIKIRLSPVLFLLSIAVFFWRLSTPDILVPLHLGSLVYLCLVLMMFAAVTVIGWFGAELTFPIEKD
jgi:predicted heme/steroid binding protein/uncharacterized membrane protein